MENQQQEIIKEQEGGVESAAAAFSMLNLSPTLHNSTTGISSPVLNLSPTLHNSTTGISSPVLNLSPTLHNSGVSSKRGPPSSLEEPSPKRATHASASTSTPASASTNHHFPGYTKRPLLQPLPSSLQGSVSGFSALNPEPEEGSKPSALQETAPSLLEAPPSTSESPNTRRYKKMEERIKEINQLCNQLQRELKESKDEESVIKDKNLTEKEEATEEVWVEKDGDFLTIHIWCPCKKGYEIILVGNSCYYRPARLQKNME